MSACVHVCCYTCLCMGDCPSNSPFLKNNGAQAPKWQRSIVFKEQRDTRTFSNLKSTHCTLLILLIINLETKKICVQYLKYKVLKCLPLVGPSSSSSSSLQYINSFRVFNTFVLAHARNNINVYKLQNVKAQVNIYKCSDKNKLSFNLGYYTGSESIICICFHGGVRQQVPLYNSSWEERIFEIVVSGAE